MRKKQRSSHIPVPPQTFKLEAITNLYVFTNYLISIIITWNVLFKRCFKLFSTYWMVSKKEKPCNHKHKIIDRLLILPTHLPCFGWVFFCQPPFSCGATIRRKTKFLLYFLLDKLKLSSSRCTHRNVKKM